MKVISTFIAGAALIALAPAANAVTYTSDPNLSDFANNATNFATFSAYAAGPASPYTPTFSTLANRVYGGTLPTTGLPAGGDNWYLATFASPESSIRVFSNIDHYGAAYDGYQFRLAGSNDGKTWTDLYNATAVSSAGEPFTLVSWTGTGPTRVNNVLSDGGPVGYIADFSFGSAYKYYAVGTSTVAVQQGNADQELSGISALGVPEPATWAVLMIGLFGAGAALRLRRKPMSALA